MNDKTATTHAGPLGSTIHVLRADADTVAALAAIERFRDGYTFGRSTLPPHRDDDRRTPPVAGCNPVSRRGSPPLPQPSIDRGRTSRCGTPIDDGTQGTDDRIRTADVDHGNVQAADRAFARLLLLRDRGYGSSVGGFGNDPGALNPLPAQFLAPRIEQDEASEVNLTYFFSVIPL